MFKGTFSTAFRGTFGGNDDFAAWLVGEMGASVVWRGTDNFSGTTYLAFPNTAYNGVSQGLDLQNVASPIAGDVGKAPYLDGANDYINGYTTNLAAIHNSTKATFIVVARVLDSSIWSDGTARNFISFTFTSGAAATLLKNTLGQIRLNKGGRAITSSAQTAVGWQMYSFAYDSSIPYMQMWINESSIGTNNLSQAANGSLSTAVFGAATVTPTSVHNGWLGTIAAFYGSVKTNAEIAAIYTKAVGG